MRAGFEWAAPSHGPAGVAYGAILASHWNAVSERLGRPLVGISLDHKIGRAIPPARTMEAVQSLMADEIEIEAGGGGVRSLTGYSWRKVGPTLAQRSGDRAAGGGRTAVEGPHHPGRNHARSSFAVCLRGKMCR